MKGTCIKIKTYSIYVTDVYARRWYLEIGRVGGSGVEVNERDEDIA